MLDQKIDALKAVAIYDGLNDHLPFYIALETKPADRKWELSHAMVRMAEANGLHLDYLAEHHNLLSYEIRGHFATGIMRTWIRKEWKQLRDATVTYCPLLPPDPHFEIDRKTTEVMEIDEIRKGGCSIYRTLLVRLHHRPTGIVVLIEGQKNLHDCRKKAKQVLQSRLYFHYEPS